MKIALVALAVALAVACGGKGATEENLRQALDQANIDDVAVTVDESGKVVRLTGTVQTMAERIRAEEVASTVVGTTGEVVSDLSVAGFEESAAHDEAVLERLDRAMDADPVLREREIDFDVTGGVVTVTGEVRSIEEKYRVSEVVRGTQGVAELDNALDIDTP